MALEVATRIADLNASNPDPDDGRGEGDDHLRMIKSVLRTLLPAVPGVASPQTAQISAGEIILSSSIVFLNSEVPGAGDILNKINTSGTHLGNLVILRPKVSTEPITIQHLASGAGRIILDAQASHLMFNVDHFMILFRDETDRWRELWRKPTLMTIQDYNVKWSVGSVQLRYDELDPNDDVPAHLQASVTWEQITDVARFVQISSTEAPGSLGGANITGGTALTVANLAVHDHEAAHAGTGDSAGLSGSESIAVVATGIAEDSKYSLQGDSGEANVGKTGKAGSGTPHTHPDIDPLHRHYRAWRRTT